MKQAQKIFQIFISKLNNLEKVILVETLIL